MLKNAYLYEERIKNAMYEIWYNPKYEFYFAGAYHTDFKLEHGECGDWSKRVFASVDMNDNLLGLISYGINQDTYSARSFAIISFMEKPSIIYGKDVMQAIDDVFCKYNLNRLDFFAIIGNPIVRTYDKFIEKLGGRVVGIQRQIVKDSAGNLRDEKIYEILREDYIKSMRVCPRCRYYTIQNNTCSLWNMIDADLEGCVGFEVVK